MFRCAIFTSLIALPLLATPGQAQSSCNRCWYPPAGNAYLDCPSCLRSGYYSDPYRAYGVWPRDYRWRSGFPRYCAPRYLPPRAYYGLRPYLGTPAYPYHPQDALPPSGDDRGAERPELYSFEGTSSCAFCDHGLRPLGEPSELGLSIDTGRGDVIIVEEAHRLYPEIYEQRFDGLPLAVRGTIIRREGRVVWVWPESLQVLRAPSTDQSPAAPGIEASGPLSRRQLRR